MILDEKFEDILINVSSKAAIAAFHFVGKKNKEAADDILYRLTILIVCGITSLGFYMSSTTICAVGLFVFIYSTLTHDDL